MNAIQAPPNEDLLLAQLVAAKLAKVMHGLMSVGAGSLQTSSAHDFLCGRHKLPLSLIEVFRCIYLGPNKVDLLRKSVDHLAEITREFHTEFVLLAGWREMTRDEVQATVNRLSQSYAEFCQNLQNLCLHFDVEVDLMVQAHHDIDMLQKSVGLLNKK
jgi:hypothetical protein